MAEGGGGGGIMLLTGVRVSIPFHILTSVLYFQFSPKSAHTHTQTHHFHRSLSFICFFHRYLLFSVTCFNIRNILRICNSQQQI